MGIYDSEIVSEIGAVASLAAYLALVPLAAYITFVPLLYFETIRKPTRNITQIDLILALVVLVLVAFVATFVALPIIIMIYLARKQKRREVTYTSDSSEESDSQEDHRGIVSQVVGLSFILFALLVAPLVLFRWAPFLIAYVVLVLVAIIALSPVLIVAASKSSEPSEGSENQGNSGSILSQIGGLSTKKRLSVISVFLALIFTSAFLVAPNYHPYDEYSGGEIGCSNHDNIRVGLGVVRYSSLNEVDKKVFRMTINDSYLVSVRDDLNETKEYQLMVTKDSGNDEIIIYEGEEKDRDIAFIPPDGLLNEPKMDISGSEYFSGELEQNQPIQYQGELYRCYIDEFEGHGGA